MKEQPIHQFEGTDMEHAIDQMVGNSEWSDLVYIKPDRTVIRVPGDQEELFQLQNPDLSGWIRVIWGTELTSSID